jgi:hypothetical protein
MIESETVWRGLEAAVVRFNRSSDQKSLLCPLVKSANGCPPKGPAASERAIAYRLAFYLESELRAAGIVRDAGPITVDGEYEPERSRADRQECCPPAEDNPIT